MKQEALFGCFCQPIDKKETCNRIQSFVHKNPCIGK